MRCPDPWGDSLLRNGGTRFRNLSPCHNVCVTVSGFMQRVRTWGKRLFRGGRVAAVFLGIAAVVTLAATAGTSRRAGMGVAKGTTTTTIDAAAIRTHLAGALAFVPRPGATSVP